MLAAATAACRHAITRWREDVTRDHYGTFCYLRDVTSGEFWSPLISPLPWPQDLRGHILRRQGRISSTQDADFETHLEIAVSPEDDIELRRLRITNRVAHARTIEITTYAEVVLAPAIADELHPAFGNLFVQTEIAAREAGHCVYAQTAGA